jgi:hypothetical protein
MLHPLLHLHVALSRRTNDKLPPHTLPPPTPLKKHSFGNQGGLDGNALSLFTPYSVLPYQTRATVGHRTGETPSYDVRADDKLLRTRPTECHSNAGSSI